MYLLVIFQIVLLGSISAILFGLDSVQSIYLVAVGTTLVIISIQLLGNMKTYLLFVWEVAFLYIIAIEGLLHYDEILLKSGSSAIPAARYLVLTFFLTIIAYLISFIFDNGNKYCYRPIDINVNVSKVHYKSTVFTVLFLIGVYFLFLFFNYENFIAALFFGRGSKERFSGNLGFLFNAINSTLSMVLPAILGYFFKNACQVKRYVLYSVLICLPIFIMLAILGNRIILLFSIGSLVILLLNGTRIKAKQIIALVLVGLLIMFTADVMTQSRTVGLANYIISNNSTITEDLLRLFYTREDVTNATSMLINYFDYNPHKYGAQTAFIFIFWIPRFVWPDKPTMLGYWLIREFQSGFSAGHSTSFGFAGDAYADFGIIGGIIFSFFFGYVIYLLDKRRKKALVNNYNVLFYAITYPFVFMAMRSLQTSFYNLFGMVIVILLFKITLKNYSVEEKLE